jgi:hypothetical protein
MVAMSNEISFSTSDTLRNETVNAGELGGNFVITIDGNIVQNSSASGGSAQVILVGGNDTFTNEKQQREPMFYMTERQKIVIYAILKTLANRTTTAKVSSDVPILDTIVKAAYVNFCG